MLGLMGEASRLTAYMRLCQCYYSSSYFDGLSPSLHPARILRTHFHALGAWKHEYLRPRASESH